MDQSFTSDENLSSPAEQISPVPAPVNSWKDQAKAYEGLIGNIEEQLQDARESFRFCEGKTLALEAGVRGN